MKRFLISFLISLQWCTLSGLKRLDVKEKGEGLDGVMREDNLLKVLRGDGRVTLEYKDSHRQVLPCPWTASKGGKLERSESQYGTQYATYS